VYYCAVRLVLRISKVSVWLQSVVAFSVRIVSVEQSVVAAPPSLSLSSLALILAPVEDGRKHSSSLHF
jgi:hypothetical protein